jgi:hypothetical protein
MQTPKNGARNRRSGRARKDPNTTIPRFSAPSAALQDSRISNIPEPSNPPIAPAFIQDNFQVGSLASTVRALVNRCLTQLEASTALQQSPQTLHALRKILQLAVGA